ncbi:hypothetical protein C6568_14590 [Melaminivora suipulveris]|uniref:Uncharacterized protein n=1 Tax=Melaminivora suipulveris TaxID=2109913 RepID=A0A2R3QHD2_9BURK|nr:hypothetical protein [Melaminivora suipulveris]AVO51160.1 hypothetical protein C6568_14590 [Melaminivora suipulveris]
MIFAKTQAGQQALKERHGAGAGLAPRQRTALILFDGKRTLQEVLAATSAMGVTGDDVQTMVEQGLLAPGAGAGPNAAAASAGIHVPDASTAAPVEGSGRTPVERYQSAYPIAIELTAGMGLRGFRLNLAVEGTTGYEELARLAPRIQQAVGDAKYARLASALFD